MGKLRYLPGKNTVIYKTKLVKGLNRNFGLYTPFDFLAAVTSHIPDDWGHLTRYYGWYSSVQRGKRIKAGLEERTGEPVTINDESPGAKAARRNWAKFIKKVYEVDPLLCPDCGGTMKVIAFIEDRAVIWRILICLRLWEEPEPRPPPIIELPIPSTASTSPASSNPSGGSWGLVRQNLPVRAPSTPSLPRPPPQKLTILPLEE